MSFATAKLVGLSVFSGTIAYTLFSFHTASINQCHKEWKNKFDSANLVAEQQLLNVKSKASEDQATLEAANVDLSKRVDFYSEALKAKRDHFPLAEACTVCRVSAERARLRTGGAATSSTVQTQVPAADQKGTESAPKEETVRRPESN